MVQLVDSFFKNLMVFDWTGTVAISIYITLGLVNILAHILNRKTECVILWGWWDVTLIFYYCYESNIYLCMATNMHSL